MIEFKNVTKRYPGGKVALDNLNLKIGDGEFVFIMGDSGAGKTTMTKLLLREERITGGELWVGGTNLAKMPATRIPKYRRRLGVVFQDFRLFKKKTVFENVAFALRVIGGADAAEVKSRVMSMLRIVGLEDKANCFPNQLSGGEQQRVSIARALAKNPKLLLCDEPTGALDYKTGKQVLALLQRTCRETGRTVIVITHNTALTAMADRIIQVKSGQILSNKVNEHPVPVEQIEW